MVYFCICFLSLRVLLYHCIFYGRGMKLCSFLVLAASRTTLRRQLYCQVQFAIFSFFSVDANRRLRAPLSACRVARQIPSPAAVVSRSSSERQQQQQQQRWQEQLLSDEMERRNNCIRRDESHLTRVELITSRDRCATREMGGARDHVSVLMSSVTSPEVKLKTDGRTDMRRWKL